MTNYKKITWPEIVDVTQDGITRNNSLKMNYDEM